MPTTKTKKKSPTTAKRRSSKQKTSAPKPSEELRVAVTFRRPDDGLGLTRYGARMTSSVVMGFRPAEDTVGRALTALEKAGFKVSARSRLAVSIRGRRSDFERLFGTKLAAYNLTADAAYSERAFYYPPDGAAWNPDPGISELIDDTYIQWPHIYMDQRFNGPPSALPPQVNYHHLRVPGDVSMVINAARVHREGVTGKGVRVAMIDSGFAHNHPYFQEHGFNSSVALASGASHADRDGNGHGTGESANLLAIAPDAIFIGVKLDNEDSQVGASVLEGFQEALNHSPQVISVSLGYDLCPTDFLGNRTSNQHLTSLPNGLKALEAEIQAAVANGVVVVFSAGNGHVSFPGMMPVVISAGGVYVDVDGAMRASDYASAFDSRIYPGRHVPDCCGLVGLAANHADYVMLPIQPGCEIDERNAQHDGTAPDDGWGVFSGTSAAAPQLAGVCALLLAANPSLTPADVKQVIRRTCRDVTEGSANPASNEDRGGMQAGPGADGATGAGLVDAFAAFRQV